MCIRDRSYTDRDGNRVDRAEWHRVVVFQKAAENCSQYLTKGCLLYTSSPSRAVRAFPLRRPPWGQSAAGGPCRDPLRPIPRGKRALFRASLRRVLHKQQRADKRIRGYRSSETRDPAEVRPRTPKSDFTRYGAP